MRYGFGAEKPEDVALRIGDHRMGQAVPINPRCRLFMAFLGADGKNLQPGILEPLPNLLLNDRSLLPAAPSKGFPEDE